MAKRFTVSDKWDDDWFLDLPCHYKLFFLYLVDKCDHAGIWKPNFRLLPILIGEQVTEAEALKYMDDKIEILSDGSWYVVNFIKYQYNCDISGLNPRNKVHQSVINILSKYKKFASELSPFIGATKPHDRGKEGAKDKEKEKDMEKDKGGIVKGGEHPVLDWIQMRMPELNTMEEPLTKRDMEILEKDYTKDGIKKTLLKMHNKWDIVQKYKSTYSTFVLWCEDKYVKPKA